jgi:hypothetical protein
VDGDMLTPATTEPQTAVSIGPGGNANSTGSFVVEMSAAPARPMPAAGSVAIAAAGAPGNASPPVGPAVATQPAGTQTAQANGAPTCGMGGPCSNGMEPVIPQPMGECPSMATGAFQFMGTTSQIWSGRNQRPRRARS